MTLALIFLILIIATITFLFIKNTKVIAIGLTIITFITTVALCINKPTLHKTFSISIIDYLIKFNTDNTISTIKQTTTTKIKEAE